MPRVRFWLNAYIPAHVKGVTMPVPHRRGASMLSVSPGCAFGIGTGYLTDAGRPNGDPTGSNSRMHSQLDVSVVEDRVIAHSQVHLTGQTEAVSCWSGVTTGRGRASTQGFAQMRFHTVPGRPGSFFLKAAAKNPLVWPQALTPAIDYLGWIHVHPVTRSVTFDGKIDAFPAFEAFVQVGGGRCRKLFQVLPGLGQSALSLIGGARRTIKKTLTRLW
jgi:hypothetical protein